MAIVVAGTLAIVHYANIGQPLASNPDPPAAVTTTVDPTITVTPGSTATAPPAAPPDPISRTPAPSSSAPTSTPPAPISPSPHPTASTPPPAAPSPPPPADPSPPPSTVPIYFRTLPPGAVLPTGAECARWVRESPEGEIRPGNWRANHITGHRVAAHFFARDKPAADQRLAPRINGHFTGTTEEILRWAACKWGINQDVVFAQAAVESWWRQSALGDWGTSASACPAGHKPTAQHPRCAQSYGILQNHYPYEKSAWPAVGDSTAMNTDTAYAIWRACYDGDETWLNTVQHVGRYHRGDMWGCVGRWFADRWYTPAAQQYIARVQGYLHDHIWLTKGFRRHNAPIVVLPNPGGSLRPA
ncbi:MAG TPA: hypothetical protein VHU92_13355 [Streptosporangiaceae bacterium]|nr:hypothetical protein [Streptosporangiaceae bacterium]